MSGKLSTPAQLAALLARADERYHVHGDPLMTDEEYDRLKDLLRQKDPGHPALAKVGHPSGKVVLPHYMGSMDKIKGEPGALARWCSRFHGPYVVTSKLDGVSALLCNGPGGARRLLTRGDGTLGEDASFMLPHILGVPDMIPAAISHVRGELVIPLADFDASLGKNPRNVVAGLVNSRRSRKTDVMSRVVFVAYEAFGGRHDRPSQQLAALRRAGFRVVTESRADELSVEGLSSELEARRRSEAFEIDGLVVLDDAAHERPRGKNPDYAFAFKSSAAEQQQTAEVRVEKVVWDVSKDNFLIPTVHYEPVELDGVTMRRATGFNAKFIVDNGIGPGARIVVVRSGQVIPYILRTVRGAQPQLPDGFARGETGWNESGVHLVAAGDSRERRVRANAYFLKTLGARGVSDKTVERMYDGGLDTVRRLLDATRDDLMRIGGFQERSAANVVGAIRAAVDGATCVKIMSASNAFGRGFAEKKLALVAAAFPDLEDATFEGLCAVDGIGEVLAAQFVANLPAYTRFLRETGLLAGAACAPVARAEAEADSGAFAGGRLVAVFTNFRDAALEASVRARGGRVVGSVSNTVTVVVNGNPDRESGKVKEAEARGIPVMTVEEFRTHLG